MHNVWNWQLSAKLTVKLLNAAVCTCESDSFDYSSFLLNAELSPSMSHSTNMTAFCRNKSPSVGQLSVNLNPLDMSAWKLPLNKHEKWTLLTWVAFATLWLTLQPHVACPPQGRWMWLLSHCIFNSTIPANEATMHVHLDDDHQACTFAYHCGRLRLQLQLLKGRCSQLQTIGWVFHCHQYSFGNTV